MMSNLFVHLTDWNPQFFREVKGRLKHRNLGAIAAISLLSQFVFTLCFWVLVPGKDTVTSRYCTGKLADYPYQPKCLLDAHGAVQINWQPWWFDQFQALSWLLPLVVLMAGVYMLIGDLGKEEKRGTLNFIRLSPQSSRSILLGKLLGVPLLPWIAVLLAIPLHLTAALQAGVTLGSVLSIYVITLAACAFFYTAALFYAFMGAAHGWLGAIVIWFSYSIVWQVWQASQTYNSGHFLYLGEWFHLQIGRNLGLFVGFVLATFAIATFWIWLAINRRFRNPDQVLLGKRQSYWMTLSFEVFILGFAFRTYPDWGDRFAITDLFALLVVNLGWYLLLIAAITPHRQTLLDWARYRKDGVLKHHGKSWRRALWRDLVWGDKSPAIIAIALNLLLPLVLFTPWILAWSDESPKAIGWFSLAFQVLFLLICALVAQAILYGKSKRRASYATSIIFGLVAIPPLAMLMLGAQPDRPTAAILWLFSAFSFAGIEAATLPTLFLGALAYFGLLTLLLAHQTKCLIKAGESEFKALTTHSGTGLLVSGG